MGSLSEHPVTPPNQLHVILTYLHMTLGRARKCNRQEGGSHLLIHEGVIIYAGCGPSGVAA